MSKKIRIAHLFNTESLLYGKVEFFRNDSFVPLQAIQQIQDR